MVDWCGDFQDRSGWDAVGPFVDANAAQLVDLLGRLVAEPSVNPPGETTGCAKVISAFLEDRGLEYEVLKCVDIKPNIVAAAKGSGAGPHLVLNGHLDTIPPGDEAAWSVPRYEMTESEGRLYGLGVGNMKAGTAALTLAYAFLAQRTDLWRGKVSFTAVADETIFAPDGAEFLLREHPDLHGDAVICGEGPGAMDLAIAEKGVCWIEITCTVPPGQGMLTTRRSVSIARLAEIIVALDALNEEIAVPPAEVACLADAAGEHGLRVSANAGLIEGGHFVSQVAGSARVQYDFRVPPGLTMEDIEARVAKACTAYPGVTWRRMKGWNPNWTAVESPLVAGVARAAEVVRGRLPRPVVRLPASDGSRWRQLGIPAICYGPQPTLASGVDDYALEKDLIDCAKVYAMAALAFLNGAA
jgi:succinyl-diaminopimelate desuccinylase